MKILFKRVAAYIIDILLVSLISTMITSNTYINKDYEKYIDTYEEYNDVYEEYSDSILELEENLEKDKISKEEYETEVEKINSSYDKKNIDYNYKLIKLSVISTVISILVILLYFVVIQYYFNGQTLGKKLMKLKVVSNSDKKLNIFNFLLRSLIINSVLINSISVIFVLVLSKNGYLIYNQIVYVINYILEVSIVTMIVFEKNHRGIHDFIANTKVVLKGEE